MPDSPTTLPPKLKIFVDELGSIDDKSARYLQLLDYGKEIGDYPTEGRLDAYLVPGCVSRVWLDAQHRDGKMHYRAAAEGQIAQGMASILVNGLSEEAPETVLALDASFIKDARLAESLTPARQGGMASMLEQMQNAARRHADS